LATASGQIPKIGHFDPNSGFFIRLTFEFIRLISVADKINLWLGKINLCPDKNFRIQKAKVLCAEKNGLISKMIYLIVSPIYLCQLR
jgi:hypothetical protein